MSDQGLHQRRRIYFSGRVQGVGFRATTCGIAEPLNVTGLVQNLNDGRVLVIVEGPDAEIERFLEQLRRTMARHIKNEEEFREAPSGEFNEFQWTY